MRLKQLKKNLDKNSSYHKKKYQSIQNFPYNEIIEKKQNFFDDIQIQQFQCVYQGIQKIKQRRQRAMLSPVQNLSEFCKLQIEQPSIKNSQEKINLKITRKKNLEIETKIQKQQTCQNIQSNKSEQSLKQDKDTSSSKSIFKNIQLSDQKKNNVQKLIQGQNSSTSNFSNNTRFNTENDQSQEALNIQNTDKEQKSPQTILFEQTFESSPEEKVKNINSNFFYFNNNFTQKKQQQNNQERKLSYQVKQQKQNVDYNNDEFQTYYSKSNVRTQRQKPYKSKHSSNQKNKNFNYKNYQKPKKSNKKSRKQKKKELSLKNQNQMNSIKKWSDSEDDELEIIQKQQEILSKRNSNKIDFKSQMNNVYLEHIQKLKKHIKNFEKPRKIILQRLNEIVHDIFQPKHIYLQEYGSYSTGLLTKYSDIDLSLQGCHQLDFDQCKRLLYNFSKKLQKFKFIKKCEPILSANIPLLKLEADPSIEFKKNETFDDSTLISVDITVDIIEDMNITSSAFRTTDFVRYCIDIYPSFFDTILFCKYWLHDKGFFNTYSGGINTFGFSLIYIAMLLQKNYINKKTNLEILLEFLQFCVEEFNQQTHGINLACNQNIFFPKQQYGQSLLVILDPTSMTY